MQEVSCFNCRNVVRITPDSDRCPECGEDLRSLLSSQYIAGYFCQRAVQIAAADSAEGALIEVERGLTYEESPDLRLLGAILAEQVQRYDLMRKMAAAIPVDDSLRKEAEWLLHAHQARQRALRGDVRVARRGQGTTGDPEPSIVAELLEPGVEHRAPTLRRGVLPVVVMVTVLVMLLGVAWYWLRGGEETAPSQADSVPALVSPEITSSEDDQVRTDGAPPASEAGAARETATPTSEVPADLTKKPTESSQLAQNSPPRAVVIAADVFDLKTYLREVGRPDLALLSVQAQLQDGRLIVRGMVTLDVQRRELLAMIEQAPGIQDVSAVDLLLRPQPTYTVQEGDTLWSVVYDIYGDVGRLDEFFEYNRDVLPSPDAMSVGIVLKVPPLE